MTLKIYIDPEVDGKEIYACPDGNPLLHQDCRQASLYARQHVLFLSEQIEHYERFIERLTHVNVAQELTFR